MHNDSNYNNKSYLGRFLAWTGFLNSSDEKANGEKMSDNVASQTLAEPLPVPDLSVESLLSSKPKTVLSLAEMLANQRRELKHVELDAAAEAAKKQQLLKERVLLNARLASPY